MRFMNAANMGTVKAVSPCVGLQTMPLVISELRVGASDDTFSFKQVAMSPERCGPSPSSAMARRYFFSLGVQRSKRTRKNPSSSAAIAVTLALRTTSMPIGLLSAAYVNLIFVGISGKLAQWFSLQGDPSIWISFVVSMALLALIMRKG